MFRLRYFLQIFFFLDIISGQPSSSAWKIVEIYAANILKTCFKFLSLVVSFLSNSNSVRYLRNLERKLLHVIQVSCHENTKKVEMMIFFVSQYMLSMLPEWGALS